MAPLMPHASAITLVRYTNVSSTCTIIYIHRMCACVNQ
jgi:hypothetical protein